MEPTSFWAKLAEYGLAGIVIGMLFVILWRMLIWVMKWVDKQADQHNAERLSWLKVLESLNQSIELHNQGSIEARKATEEAHKYQKAEHEKLAEGMNTVCSSLKETEKALGRINGYK
jgi:hypothetical protein